MINKYALGLNIRVALNEVGKNQKWLAEQTGVSLLTISNYVCGLRIPKAVNLYKISKALGVSMEYLMTGVIEE